MCFVAGLINYRPAVPVAHTFVYDSGVTRAKRLGHSWRGVSAMPPPSWLQPLLNSVSTVERAQLPTVPGGHDPKFRVGCDEKCERTVSVCGRKIT